MTEPQANIPYLDALEPAARSAFGRAPDLAAISQAISLRRIADALERLTRSNGSAGGTSGRNYGYGAPDPFVGGGGAGGSPNTTLFTVGPGGSGGGAGGSPNTTRVTVGPGGSGYPPIGDSPAERVGGSAADPRGIHRTFDPEGWHRWDGGREPPMPDAVPVEVRFRDGTTDASGTVDTWIWGPSILTSDPRDSDPRDIVAWRLAR